MKQSQWEIIWIAILYIFEVKFPSFASNCISIMIYFKVLVKLFLQNCAYPWLYNFVDQLWENVSCYLRVRPTGKQGQLKVKISQLYSLLFQRPNVMTTVVLYHTLELNLGYWVFRFDIQNSWDVFILYFLIKTLSWVNPAILIFSRSRNVKSI